MALLFMDGFAGGDAAYKWDIPSGTYTVSTTTIRTPGNYAAGCSNGVYLYKSLVAANKIIMGFGVYTNTNAFATFYGDSGVTAHISVVRNTSTGFLEIRRGTYTGTLLATGTTAIFDLRWNYVEVSATISDTVGEVHVRMNGQPTDEVSYTGDTKSGGTNTTIDRVALYSGNGVSLFSYFADVYILNGLGAANNNFLGDVIVRTLTPSANGSSSDLTGSDGDQVNNYLLVDEHPASATDYVESATSGHRDTYTMSDLPAGVTTVYGAQASGLMWKSDATAGSSKIAIKSGASVYYGANRSLGTSSTMYFDLFENNPATSVAWTVSDINALESGMEVI